MSKKTVILELYNQKDDQQYIGRCVGLLSDKEFNAIISRPEVQKKLITSRTVPLAEIAIVKDIQDLRLAIIIKVNCEEVTKRKKLFVTEPIELVSEFISPGNLTMIGTGGSYTTIEETEE